MTPPIPMPFAGRNVPHLVIEVNQECTLSCTACYKAKRAYSKPLSLVLEEIDLGARRRNLDVITLAGGEPTLHPDLPAIIRAISGRGIKVNLLTNGVGLTAERLREYGRAGLTRAMLHIDSLQSRPDARPGSTEAELNLLREALLERVVAEGLHGGLAMTAYQRNLAEIPSVVRFLQRSPSASALLITCCGQFAPIAERYGTPEIARTFRAGEPEGEQVTARKLARVLERELGLSPTQYVQSSLREDEWRWLLYLGFAIGDGNGRTATLSLSSRFARTIRLGNSLQLALKGRYKFDMVPGPAEAIAVCALYAALGCDPMNALETGRFLWVLRRRGARIRSKVLVVQQAPNLTESGEIEHCRNCPDATVRNGEIVPLCLADILHPLDAA